MAVSNPSRICRLAHHSPRFVSIATSQPLPSRSQTERPDKPSSRRTALPAHVQPNSSAHRPWRQQQYSNANEKRDARQHGICETRG